MSSIDLSTRAIIGYSGSILAILFLLIGTCIQIYQVTCCQRSNNGTYSFEFKEDSEYKQQHLNQDHDPAELSPRSESYKNRSMVPRPLISEGVSFSHLAPDPDDYPDSEDDEGYNAV